MFIILGGAPFAFDGFEPTLLPALKRTAWQGKARKIPVDLLATICSAALGSCKIMPMKRWSDLIKSKLLAGVLGSLITTICGTGCLSYEQIVGMRADREPNKIADDQKKLLHFLEQPGGDVPKRSAALETSVVLSNRANLPVTDKPTFDRVFAVFGREYQLTPIKNAKPFETQTMRRWSLYCAGQADSPVLIHWLIQRVDDLKDGDDRAAALNALVPKLGWLQTNAADRTALLRTLSGTDASGTDPSGRNRELRDYFVGELFNYNTSIELLEDVVQKSGDPTAARQAISWNWRFLNDMRVHSRAPSDPGLVKRNLDALLVLTRSRDATVAANAATLLKCTWPAALADELNSRLAAGGGHRPLAEVQELARLLFAIESLPAAGIPPGVITAGGQTVFVDPQRLSPSARVARENTALPRVLTATESFDAEGRMATYAILMPWRRAEVCHHVLVCAGPCLKEDAPRALAEVIMLEHVGAGPEGATAEADAATEALARYVAFGDAGVRREAAAALVAMNRADEFIRAAEALMPSIAAQSSDDVAVELCDDYMRVLNHLSETAEGRATLERLAPDSQTSAARLMANALDRPESDLRLRVVAFLQKHEPDKLIAALGGRLIRGETVDADNVGLIGEALRQLPQTADGSDTVATAMAQIARAVQRAGNEDQALHAARTLAEARQPARKDALESLLGSGEIKYNSVRLLCESAARAN